MEIRLTHYINTIEQAAEELVGMVRSGKATRATYDFNEIELVAVPGATASQIVAGYMAECERRHQAYIASPEYAESCRRAEKAQRVKELVTRGALVVAPAEPTFSDPAIWQSWVDANKDGYGGAVMSYAARWARLMEGQIAAGSTVAECAKECSSLADVEGITGFMYGCAVAMLSKAWAHGEDLRRWFYEKESAQD